MSRGLAGTFTPRAREPLRLLAPAANAAHILCRLEGRIFSRPGAPAPPPGADEERLAADYRRWGAALVERLRGEFALLLWDGERREGLLAADALGVGSVYYHYDGELTFATELRDLLAILPRTPAPDDASVAHWLAASARPGAFTLFDGIKRLEPGTMLELGGDGALVRTFWRPRYRPFKRIEREQAVAEVRAALLRAVGERLAPLAPTGVLMSGGLDSGSVAALAAVQAPGRVRAYAGVFPDHASVDESVLIAQLRARLRLAGLDAEVACGGLLAAAGEWAQECRVPQLGWSDGWTLPLLKGAAAEGVGVVLGGDGGDELFGAPSALIADAVRDLSPFRALALARNLPGAGLRPPRRELAGVLWRMGVLDARPRRFAAAGSRLRPAHGLPRWLLPASARALRDSDDPFEWMRMDGPRWWARAAHGLCYGIARLGVFEHQRLRAARAGVAASHPLLDLDLVELVLALPPELGFDRDLSRPLLRQALAGTLPDTVRMRPGKAWFDELVIGSLTGPDAGALRSLLAADRPEVGAYVRLEPVRELLRAGPPAGPGRFGWMHAVWRLASAECWLRVLAGRELPPAPAAPVRLRAMRGGLGEASSVFQP